MRILGKSRAIRNEREIDNNAITSILPRILDSGTVMEESVDVQGKKRHYQRSSQRQ